MTAYTAIVTHLRNSYREGKILPLAKRKEQLQSLKRMLKEEEDTICDAIRKDIRRCKAEAICYELLFTENDIDTMLSNLDKWTAPQKVHRTVLQIMDSAFIQKDPLGVVLVIAPWNYPFQLAMLPVVGAIAAGNCVVLKPSEVSEYTSAVLASLIPKYLDPDVVRVVTGGVQETTELLKERFDHIFYTGNPTVGKAIMTAATKNLTPVTLELGGKSPVFVDDTGDISVIARRLGWGKFMSAGQTCLAPDYVLCLSSVKNELVKALQNVVHGYYGQDPQKSPDYSRIINARHFDRLVPLMKSGQIAFGGKQDKDDLYIEPTVLDNVKPTDPVMRDEIFGPILPIITVRNVDEAIQFINEREKPLSLYIFTENKKTANRFLNETSSGGVTINDCILHIALDTLPFGGVGNSGIGRYHGKFSFDTFTHEKAVLHRSLRGEKILWMRYPPYDDSKFFWARLISRKRALPESWIILYVPLFLIGVLFGYMMHACDILTKIWKN